MQNEKRMNCFYGPNTLPLALDYLKLQLVCFKIYILTTSVLKVNKNVEQKFGCCHLHFRLLDNYLLAFQ